MNQTQHPVPMRYKVLSMSWTHTGWRQDLENELNRLAALGYRPILYSDGGNQCTIILEKLSE